MAVTYEPIASTTLGANAATISLTNIPGTFTDLILVSTLVSPGLRSPLLRFNSDVSSVYSFTELWGDGTSAQSTRDSATSNFYPIGYYIIPDSTSNYVSVAHIMSYANTNVFKTMLSRTTAVGYGVDLQVGLWRSTSAITSITINFSGVFDVGAGSRLSLYGIKAA